MCDFYLHIHSRFIQIRVIFKTVTKKGTFCSNLLHTRVKLKDVADRRENLIQKRLLLVQRKTRARVNGCEFCIVWNYDCKYFGVIDPCVHVNMYEVHNTLRVFVLYMELLYTHTKWRSNYCTISNDLFRLCHREACQGCYNYPLPFPIRFYYSS